MPYEVCKVTCRNLMAFQTLFNLESIKRATQATLILETLNVLVQLQQKAEKALDFPLLVTTTAQ